MPQPNRAVARARRAQIRAFAHRHGVHPATRVADARGSVRGPGSNAAHLLRGDAARDGVGDFERLEKLWRDDAMRRLFVFRVVSRFVFVRSVLVRRRTPPETVHALPRHHRAFLGGAPQADRAVVAARDPGVWRDKRARLELPRAGRRAEDELRVLGDFPEAARAVPAHGDHALATLRSHAHHLRLVPEQRVHVRHVVQAPHLERAVRRTGEELAGPVADRQRRHRAAVRRQLLDVLHAARVPDVNALVRAGGAQ
mmetsp:Transcript_11442/g.47987  ORF Transcript_11442/g.47987 Transcript_11442/m.47987 type:complete len:255 (+) Transcript_11442:273-1037(+)